VKRLVVMRHAKSAWDGDAPTDHARPLNDRGRQDAPRIAAEMLRRGWVPEVVLSSDAARTRETWDHMARALPPARLVAFIPALYHAGIGAVQSVFEPLGADVGTVLVLGHNPGFEEAVDWLSGQYVELTTANAALLVHADATWADAVGDVGAWRLEGVLRPKDL